MVLGSWLIPTSMAVLGLAAVRLSAQTPEDVHRAALPSLESGNRPGLGAPNFTLKTLAGPEASLSDYKGHPVLINFWASWCKPCRSEMPDIVAAYQAHKETGLEVLAINLTDQEGMKDVRKFVAEFQMPFPVLLDEKGQVRRLYALRGLPTTVFIGADGVVRLVNPGPITAEKLKQGLAETLQAP
jgi:thiol-disulfide isomerase/thioredoxin